MNTADRKLMQAILKAMENLHRTGDTQVFDMYDAPELIPALRDRLAHCDRCGKRLGGEGDIHTCTPLELRRFEKWWDAEDDIPNDGPYTPDTPIQFAWAGWQAALAQPKQEPDPIGDAQDKLIAEMAAQPEQKWQYGTPLLNLFTKQPEQKPVGMRWRWPGYAWVYTEEIRSDLAGNPEKELLYATPPAAMTEFEEAVAAVDNTLHHAIDHWQDRALKAEAKLAQPEQEPVEWLTGCPECGMDSGCDCDSGTCTPPAAQRQWVGLTDEEMYLNCPNWLSQEHCKVWIQQIEAKLKEKNT
jgi:hypothetical protein